MELLIEVIAIQEPWIIKETDLLYRSVTHFSFKQILPDQALARPRTLFYISNKVLATLAPSSPQDPDCVIIDLTDSIQLINVYNAIYPNLPNSIPTI